MKTYKQLQEGLFSLKKPMTAKELALKNNKKYTVPVVDKRTDVKDPINKSDRSINKSGQHDKQDWKFEHVSNFINTLK